MLSVLVAHLAVVVGTAVADVVLEVDDENNTHEINSHISIARNIYNSRLIMYDSNTVFLSPRCHNRLGECHKNG
jgi:hypothetical protein